MAEYGTMSPAFLGMLYGTDYVIDSFVCTEAVSPGKPVYQTPGSPGTVHATYVSGDVFVGIAVASQRSTVNSVGVYEAHEVVNVLKEGSVWVAVASTVSTAPTAAYATASGTFSVTASGNYDVGALFRTNGSSLAVVEIHGPKVIA